MNKGTRCKAHGARGMNIRLHFFAFCPYRELYAFSQMNPVLINGLHVLIQEFTIRGTSNLSEKHL